MFQISEIKSMLRTGEVEDGLGLRVFLLSMLLIVVAMIFPVCVLLQLDPIQTYFCYIRNWESSPSLTCLSLFLAYWTTMEMARSFATMLTSAVVALNMTGNVLKSISTAANLKLGLQDYVGLQIINRVGQQGIREEAGVLMFAGCLIAITCNYMVIYGAQRLPVTLYLCFIFLDLAIYLVISQTLPLILGCYEHSLGLVKRYWFHEMLRMRGRLSDFEMRVARKTIHAQTPINYYYWSAKFDQNTKCNYYWTILEFTINLLLI